MYVFDYLILLTNNATGYDNRLLLPRHLQDNVHGITLQINNIDKHVGGISSPMREFIHLDIAGQMSTGTTACS